MLKEWKRHCSNLLADWRGIAQLLSECMSTPWGKFFHTELNLISSLQNDYSAAFAGTGQINRVTLRIDNGERNLNEVSIKTGLASNFTKYKMRFETIYNNIYFILVFM